MFTKNNLNVLTSKWPEFFLNKSIYKFPKAINKSIILHIGVLIFRSP